MNLSDENKKSILEGFIDIFTRIASKNYQERIWIRGEGPEVDDFDDTVCDFFVECDSILEDPNNFGISENQYEILKHFRDQFRIFTDENSHPKEFINTIEWENIRKMAKQVLREFNYNKKRD